MINVQNQLWILLYVISILQIKNFFFVFVKDINEYQFGQYECRGTNSLGEKSDYVYIEQSN